MNVHFKIIVFDITKRGSLLLEEFIFDKNRFAITDFQIWMERLNKNKFQSQIFNPRILSKSRIFGFINFTKVWNFFEANFFLDSKLTHVEIIKFYQSLEFFEAKIFLNSDLTYVQICKFRQSLDFFQSSKFWNNYFTKVGFFWS